MNGKRARALRRLAPFLAEHFKVPEKWVYKRMKRRYTRYKTLKDL